MERFAVELRRLRESAGRPQYRELARRAHYSVATLSAAAGGRSFPSLAVTLAYVEACGGDRRTWEARWRSVAQDLVAADSAADELADGQEAPYRGLETFEADDAEWFFGRQRLVDELAARLSNEPFLAVFGASGSGKSSLLRAGLLPTLGRDAENRPALLITPGEHPVEALAAALAAITKGSLRTLRDDLTAEPQSIRLTIRQMLAAEAKSAFVVLVVDQFEEVFTLCRDAAERMHFISCLLAAVSGTGGRARVVLGVRADFYARCADFPALATALSDRQVLVGAMADEDLREVVTGPAAGAGLKVEQALVEVIVADARGEPGALPLVSHALLETWRRRRAETLTLAAYRSVGGIRGGIAQTAERVFDGLDQGHQQIAQQIFLRLTALGEGTEDTRRRVRTSELFNSPDRQAVKSVLDKLVEARLITVGEGETQVAHEAVIRHWPRLRGWLNDDRDLLRAHRRLSEAAAEWDEHGRDDELLYRGTRLAVWDTYGRERLNTMERIFLKDSFRRQSRERTAKYRRTQLAVVGVISVVVAVGVLAAMTVTKAAIARNQAIADRDLAVAGRLTISARNQLQFDPVRAVRLARRAYARTPTPQTEDALRQATLQAGLGRVINVGDGPSYGVAFSRDGRNLAVVMGDSVLGNSIRVGRPAPEGLAGPGGTGWWHDGAARTPVFHPDGRHLASAGPRGAINVWDVSDHQGGSANPLLLGTGASHIQAWSVAFSPDGRWLAGAGGDGAIQVWDWAARDPAPTVLRGHSGRVLSVAFSPDGRRIASGGDDGTVRIWDRTKNASSATLHGHRGPVESVAFSPDGRQVASGGDDGTIRIWSTTGRDSASVLNGHTGAVTTVAYSPDARRLASGGDDGTVRIWDSHPATGVADPLVLDGLHGKVWSVAYAPDGRSVASGSDDGTTQLWDVTGSGNPIVLRGHKGPVWDATASRDGRKIASVGEDGTIRVQNIDGTGSPLVLHGHAGKMFGVAFSPDGTRVAGTGENGTIQIWNAKTADRPVVVLRTPADASGDTVWDVTFTSGGRYIVGATTHAVFRWNARHSNDSPSRLAETSGELTNGTASSPPDQSWRARVNNGTLRTYQMAKPGDPNSWRGHTGLVFHDATTASGWQLASQGTQDNAVQLWNPEGVSHPGMLHHNAQVRSVAVSPNGGLVATTAVDHTVRIWNSTGNHEPLIFRGHGISVENINFAPDGRLITTYDDGTIKIWRCEVCGPIDQVIALADKRIHG